MNRGAVAKASGLSAKMIRHYESIGLVATSPRTDTGYRQYNSRDIHLFRFVHHSRELGFSLAQIKDLLSLWEDQSRASADVKQLTANHIAELNARIQGLTHMCDTLKVELANACCGDARPDCPILHQLEVGLDN
jgi:MerR family copper efflux transcriptional regulator